MNMCGRIQKLPFKIARTNIPFHDAHLMPINLKLLPLSNNSFDHDWFRKELSFRCITNKENFMITQGLEKEKS